MRWSHALTSVVSKPAAALLAGLVLALPALASPLTFHFTPDGGGPALVFTLDSNPAPSSSGSFFFLLSGVDALYGGAAVNLDQLRFFSDLSGGGFNAEDDGIVLVDTTGAQLYTGSTDAPVFAPGSFTLDEGIVPDTVGGTLTIAAAPTSVPEPATLALLGVAAAGMGAARLRRRA